MTEHPVAACFTDHRFADELIVHLRIAAHQLLAHDVSSIEAAFSDETDDVVEIGLDEEVPRRRFCRCVLRMSGAVVIPETVPLSGRQFHLAAMRLVAPVRLQAVAARCA